MRGVLVLLERTGTSCFMRCSLVKVKWPRVWENYVASLFRKYSQPSRVIESQKKICVLVFNLLSALEV